MLLLDCAQQKSGTSGIPIICQKIFILLGTEKPVALFYIYLFYYSQCTESIDAGGKPMAKYWPPLLLTQSCSLFSALHCVLVHWIACAPSPYIFTTLLPQLPFIKNVKSSHKARGRSSECKLSRWVGSAGQSSERLGCNILGQGMLAFSKSKWQCYTATACAGSSGVTDKIFLLYPS